MRQKIDCFVACHSLADIAEKVEQLQQSTTVSNIFLLVNGDLAEQQPP